MNCRKGMVYLLDGLLKMKAMHCMHRIYWVTGRRSLIDFHWRRTLVQ